MYTSFEYISYFTLRALEGFSCRRRRELTCEARFPVLRPVHYIYARCVVAFSIAMMRCPHILNSHDFNRRRCLDSLMDECREPLLFEELLEQSAFSIEQTGEKLLDRFTSDIEHRDLAPLPEGGDDFSIWWDRIYGFGIFRDVLSPCMTSDSDSLAFPGSNTGLQNYPASCKATIRP